MSTIRKKPFIESVLSSLSSTQLVNILALIDNTNTSVVQKDYYFTDYPASNGIYLTRFKLSDVLSRTGILVLTDTYKVLISYDTRQAIIIYKLNFTNSTFEKVDEYCDINELRRILKDATGSAVDVTDLKNKLEAGDGMSVDFNDDSTKVRIGFDSTVNPWLITLDSTAISGTVQDTTANPDYTKLAQSRVALIKRGDTYFYKAEDSTTAMTYVSATTSQLKKIVITKSTKAWAYSAVTVKTGAVTGIKATVGTSSLPLGGVTVLTIANEGISRATDFPTTFEEAIVGANTFIKFPTFYRKINSISNGQITSFTISTEQDDISYVPYSCFVDESGNILPYVLMGKYMSGTAVDNKLISQTVADADVASYAIATGRTYATNNGTGYQLFDWQMQKLMQDLAVVVLGTTNTNDGTGFDVLLGMYNQKKGFWVDGVAKSTDDKWLFGTKPTNYINEPTSSSTGYVETYSTPTAEGWITALGYTAGVEFGNYPSVATGGGPSNYYCDYYYYTSGNRPVYSYVGYASTSYGVWSCYVLADWSSTFATRLCYRPLS